MICIIVCLLVRSNDANAEGVICVNFAYLCDQTVDVGGDLHYCLPTCAI